MAVLNTRIAVDPLVGDEYPQPLSTVILGYDGSVILGFIFDQMFARAVSRAEDISEGGELPEGEYDDWRRAEALTWAEALGPGWRSVTVNSVRYVLEHR